jgi:PAS domain S-box-containing protein
MPPTFFTETLFFWTTSCFHLLVAALYGFLWWSCRRDRYGVLFLGLASLTLGHAIIQAGSALWGLGVSAWWHQTGELFTLVAGLPLTLWLFRVAWRIRQAPTQYELERTAQALAASERRWRILVQNFPSPLYLKTTDTGTYCVVNQAFLQLFSKSAEDIIGKTDAELFPAEISTQLRANDRQVAQGHVSRRFEEAVLVRGELRTFLSVKFLLNGDSGWDSLLCGISVDITEHKKRESTLQETVGRLDRQHRSLMRLQTRESPPLADLESAISQLHGLAQGTH